uniref:DDE Tnp4 domain-containing protein n=1 Tax=Pundamilia nyererei TaxID=303518 RepID=A0A3B4GB47_9CICH
MSGGFSFGHCYHLHSFSVESLYLTIFREMSVFSCLSSHLSLTYESYSSIKSCSTGGINQCFITQTLTALSQPNIDEAVFVNRRHFHSINVQIVFNAACKILDIVAKWPGSTHDARMLSESGIRQLFERRYVPANCHLLGDSGYPCTPWLLTPYLQPHQGPQLNYNRAHKTTRAVVERGIGQLKRRFHVLHREVQLRPEKVSKVIIACAILHNISFEGRNTEKNSSSASGLYKYTITAVFFKEKSFQSCFLI